MTNISYYDREYKEYSSKKIERQYSSQEKNTTTCPTCGKKLKYPTETCWDCYGRRSTTVESRTEMPKKAENDVLPSTSYRDLKKCPSCDCFSSEDTSECEDCSRDIRRIKIKSYPVCPDCVGDGQGEDCVLEDGYCSNCGRTWVIPKKVKELHSPESEESMATTTPKLTDALQAANKGAATVAARVEAGKVLVHKALTVARAQAPAAAGPYLDHPLAGLVIANLFFAAAHQYLPDNQRLKMVTEIMLEGAAQEFFAGVNIEKMLDNFLAGVNLSGVGLPVRIVEEQPKEGVKKSKE